METFLGVVFGIFAARVLSETYVYVSRIFAERRAGQLAQRRHEKVTR